MSVTLGYWAIQGLAEPIRQMMEYLQIPYNCQEYSGQEGFVQFSTIDGPALKTPFPNLPFLIDGDVHLAQSKAIILYLAKKSGKYAQLFGSNDKEEVEIEELFGHIKDLYSTLTGLCYNENFESVKDSTINGNFLKKLKEVDGYYTKRGTKFIYGNEITYADFWARATLFILFAIDETKKNDFPKLVEYLNNYMEVPALKEYFDHKMVKRPINNPLRAKFY